MPALRLPDEKIQLGSPDQLTIRRNSRVSGILTWMSEHPVGLLRAPPKSGKTSTIDLLAAASRASGRTVVALSLLDLDGRSFDEFWRAKTSRTWAEWRAVDSATDIFIDEAQRWYGDADATGLWAGLKSLKQNPNRNLRVLLFASRRYSDLPLELPALGLADLLLRREEFDEYMGKYSESPQGRALSLAFLADAIFRSTGGHVGLVRDVISALYDRARDFVTENKQSVTEQQLTAWLVSPELIGNSRALVRAPSQSSQQAVLTLLLEEGENVPLTQPLQQDAAAELEKLGILVPDTRRPDVFSFSSPLQRRKIFEQLFKQSSVDRITDLDSFVPAVLNRMRVRRLAEALSRDAKGVLFEDHWQKEFYAAATALLPASISVSCNVGKLFQSPGYCDFYVDSDLQWLIELVREGQKLQEHIDRMKPSTGVYAKIPRKRVAVLDFRSASSPVPRGNFSDDVWFLRYAKDYMTITIHRGDRPPQIVQLSPQ